MKAIGFKATGNCEKIEVLTLSSPSAPLKEGELRLSFLAGALNHLDLWVVKGLPRLKYIFPHIAGADLCAQVVESRSKAFAVGDEIILYPAESSGLNSQGHIGPENLCPDFRIRGENAHGVFAEEIVVQEKFAFHRPPHLSVSEAAALPLTFLTAWQMLKEKALEDKMPEPQQLSAPVLVHGAGSGVTFAVVSLLRSMGFTRIAVTSREKEKFLAYHPSATFFVGGSNLENDLKAWLQNDRFMWVFDHVGELYFEMNIRLLCNAGKLITCGATSGAKANLDLRHLYFRQLQILGSTMGSLKHFKEMLEWIEQKKIKPLVARKFHFDDARNAYLYLESQTQVGKVILSRTP